MFPFGYNPYLVPFPNGRGGRYNRGGRGRAGNPDRSGRISELTRENSNLHDSLGELRSQNIALEQRLSEKTQEGVDYKREKKREIRDLKDRLDSLEEEKEICVAEIAQIKSCFVENGYSGEPADICKKLKEDMEKLKKKIANDASTVQKAKIDVESAHQMTRAAEEMKRQYGVKIVDMDVKLREKERELERLRDRIYEYSEQQTSSEHQIRTHLRTIQDLRDELEIPADVRNEEQYNFSSGEEDAAPNGPEMADDDAPNLMHN